MEEKEKLYNNDLIKKFFVRLILLVLVLGLGYHFILKPIRVPDKILTDVTAAGTAICLNVFSDKYTHFNWRDFRNNERNKESAAIIEKNGKDVFSIVDTCNAIDYIAIYIGFIILLPSSIKRKLIFSIVGTIVIVIANVIRCASLYWIYWNYHTAFEFNHHYTFTIIIYILIFIGWILFIKKELRHENS